MSIENIHAGPGLAELVIHALERADDLPAFVNPDGQAITYAALRAQVSGAMQCLDALGIARGDAVVQIAGNRAEAFAVVASCYIGGRILVGPAPTASLDDHAFILESCEARVLIVDAANAARALTLNERLGGRLLLLCHDAHPGIDSLWRLAAQHTPRRLVAGCAPDEVVRLIYTGGTTGKPKGVMASGASIAMNVMLRMATHDWRGLRYLCSSPMSHASGQLIVPVLAAAGTVVLHDGFDTTRVLDTLAAGEANSLYVVPTMLYKLLDHPRARAADWGGLRMIMYGAAPVSPVRLREARELFGPVLIQHYGLSEAPSTLLCLDQHDHLDDRCLASAGKPYPGVTVRLLDDAGQEVPPGEVGEICVRSPLVMDGYWREPELTAAAMQGGWLHSGDLARQDERGYFFIVDRKKDMIISGGFNVYPKEVEDVIASHPAVAGVAVIGVPDATWGEAVKALVVLRAGRAATAQELVQLVRERKGAVQAPKSIEFVASLPLTALGKPDKKAMRAAHWDPAGRNVH